MLVILQKIFYIIRIKMYFIFKFFRLFGARQFGALSVEYAFCMILAAVFLEGVFALFSEMSADILGEFMEWISSSYP